MTHGNAIRAPNYRNWLKAFPHLRYCGRIGTAMGNATDTAFGLTSSYNARL